MLYSRITLCNCFIINHLSISCYFMSSQNSEFAKLENELIELRGKLEMAQLHMEQLQNSSSSGAAAAAGALDQSATATQIEGLLNEKAQLETKLEQVRA